MGEACGHCGNAKVLKTVSLAVPSIPLLWLVSGNLVYLVAVELYAGFVWGGFNLCAANFIYDAVTPEKRVRYLGYFNLINGVAVSAGASLGGFLVGHLPLFRGSHFMALFLTSGLLRFAAHYFLSRHFHEVRESARPVSSLQLFFSMTGFRPLNELNRERGQY